MDKQEKKLRKLYYVDKKGTWAIAKEFDVSQMTITRWFKQYKIKTRSCSEAAKLSRNGFKENELHPFWKGDKVGYQALHTWVRSRLGTPKKCEHCGTTKPRKYEWANIGHTYKRNLKDWIRLCTSCHRLLDKDKLNL